MGRSIPAIVYAAPFGPCSMSVLTLVKSCARNEREALVFGVRLKTMFQSSWSSGGLPYGRFDIDVDREFCPSSIKVDRTILDSPNRSNENQRATKVVNKSLLASFVA